MVANESGGLILFYAGISHKLNLTVDDKQMVDRISRYTQDCQINLSRNMGKR